jgi:phosphotransferase system enzyme I (PtsI)
VSEVLQGQGVVAGVAIGRVMMVSQDLDQYMNEYQPGDAHTEQERLHEAIETAGRQLNQSIKGFKEKGQDDQAAIMEAHLMMVQDSVLAGSIVDKIEKSLCAPKAVLEASEEYAAMFASMEDPYLKERATDVRDVGRRIAKIILGVKEPEIRDEAVILCGLEIEPSVVANVPADKIKGIILGQGSTTSHAVIIAKSRGLVSVVGLADRMGNFCDGMQVVVDGHSGEVFLNPAADKLNHYQQQVEEQQKKHKKDLEMAGMPAVTADGVRVQLAANVGLPQDIDNALKFGCEGVGLYRTEFLFMGRDTMPSEEDQFKAYKYVAERCNGHLCVIRTMDIGGDKPLPYLEIPKEDNPFLGYRAVRISLKRPDLFVPQLKAILRAGIYGKVAIMLPMVISLSEIRKAKEFLAQAMTELDKEGKAYAKDVPVGIMVETPAAAVMTPVLAKECDFFSIGTNDLVQYTLAVDRVNPNVADLYNHMHPAVLRLIYTTIKAARDNNIWAGMCGEMAGDPLSAVMLLGMGIHELSMSGPAIPRVKETIRGITLAKARQLMEHVLTLDDGNAVKEYLKKNI